MSARELIREAQKEVREGDLTPQLASDLLVRLTSLLSTVLTEIRDADMAYNAVLLAHLNGEEAANRARIRAQTTPEYARAREAKDTKDVLLELIRSLKIVLRTQTEEMRLTKG